MSRRFIGKVMVALVLVRCLANIPLASPFPDVRHLFREEPFLVLIDIFAGGATARSSLLALSIYPYLVGRLAASIFCSTWREMNEERREYYAYRCSTLAAVIMGSTYLYTMTSLHPVLPINNILIVCDLLSLTAATMLFLRIAQSVQGGLKLIIAANVIAAMPYYIHDDLHSGADIAFMVVTLLIVTIIHRLFGESSRGVPVQFFSGSSPQKRYIGRADPLPIYLDSSGVLPLFYLLIAFAAIRLGTCLLANSEISWIRSLALFERHLTDVRGSGFWVLFCVLAVPFKTAYGIAQYNLKFMPERLRSELYFIVGLRPGARTTQFLRPIYIRLGWIEPVITMLSVTVPALLFRALWPFMLIPFLYTIEAIWDLILYLKSELAAGAAFRP